jgi:8-oxo-dGTP pyrophosphatase MutT (NUDIX family)
MVLIEGRWGESEPVGITAGTLAELAAPLAERTVIEQLAYDSVLWGREVADERYAAVLRVAPPRRHSEIVDVHLILRRGDDILLARRANTGYADGLFNAPSGHVEDGEDVRAAMIREAEEEIGVALDPDRLSVALVMQHRAPDGSPRIGWFFEARVTGGDPEPVNSEPDKCSELGWFPLDAMPDDMVAYCRAGIDAYRAGESFALHLHERGDAIAHDAHGPGRMVVLPRA